MKLPILPCAEKLESQFCLPHQKHEVTPIKSKTVKTDKSSPGDEIPERNVTYIIFSVYLLTTEL